MPPVGTVGPHPRLLFSRDELPEQRRGVRQGRRGEALQFILGWCARLLDPGNEHYFDYKEMRRPFWAEREGLGVWRASMVHLSLAYLFTGEEKYGAAARDAMVATIECGAADRASVAYGTPTRGWRGSLQNSHDRGQYAQAACIAYDCCHDLFNDKQRRQFIDHALEGMKVYDDPLLAATDRQFITHNHGRSFLLLGWYSLAVEGEVELPKIESSIARATAAVELYLLSAFDQQGYPFEGFMYAQCIRDYYLYLHALAHSGRQNLTAHPAFERLVHAMVYDVLPTGGTCNNLNDCHWRNGSPGPLIPIMGTPTGAAVPWLVHKISDDPRWRDADQRDLVASHMDNPAVYVALFWNDGVPLKTPAELGYPASHAFPGVGVTCIRTGWDEQDLHLNHRCGPLKFTMHRQSDQNHLTLYALGERFLVDEGYGELMEQRDVVKKDALDRYFGRSDVHNTVLIDGRGQNGNAIDGGYAEGKLVDWVHGPRFDTSMGDASACYTANRIIARAMRRVIFIRQAAHPFILVIDDLAVDNTEISHRFEVLWRTEKGNHIGVEGQSFTIEGKKNRCAGQVMVASSDAVLNVVEHFGRPQLRVEMTAPRLRMVTALTPLRPGEPPPKFTCRFELGDDYLIHAADAGQEHRISASTSLQPPLMTPAPVTYGTDKG